MSSTPMPFNHVPLDGNWTRKVTEVTKDAAEKTRLHGDPHCNPGSWR